MHIKKIIDKSLKNIKWFDISLIKISCIFFGMWLVCKFPNTFLTLHPSTYLVIWLLTGALVAYRLFFNKK